MTQDEIRAIAHQLHTKLPMATQEDAANFLIAALAAINAAAEPVARFDVTASGHYALIFKNQLVKEENLKPGAKFYTHPDIEPAPQQVNEEAVSMTQAHAPAVGAAQLPDEVKACSLCIHQQSRMSYCDGCEEHSNWQERNHG